MCWSMGVDLSDSDSVTAVVYPAGVTLSVPATVELPGGRFSPLPVIGRQSVVVGDQLVSPAAALRELVRGLVGSAREQVQATSSPKHLVVRHPQEWDASVRASLRQLLVEAEPAAELTMTTEGDLVAVLVAHDDQRPSSRRVPGRRTAVALTAAAVLVVAGAGAGAVIWSGSGSGPGEDAAEVFYDSTGHMDCRNLYTAVPVSMAYRAGFGVDAADLYARIIEEGSDRSCPVNYRGVQVTDDMTLLPELVVASTDRAPDDGAADTYRGWSVTDRGVSTGSDSHGWLTVSLPEDPANDALVAAGLDVPAMLREIVDGIEDSRAPVVRSGTTPAFREDGTFSCAAFYDRLSMDGISELGYYPPLASGAPGGVEAVLGTDGRGCLIDSADWRGPMEISVGADDADGGDGERPSDLAGWTEWWRTSAPDNARWGEFEGEPSANVRTCRSAADCITVTSHRTRFTSDTEAIAEPALQVARLIEQISGEED